MKKYNLGVFPGVFDPFTNGHYQIVKFALKNFKVIHIVIMENPNKKTFFTLEKRLEFISHITNEQIKVFYWPGLATDYCHKNKTSFLIRGYRNEHDLVYENKLKKAYLKYDKNIEIKLYKSTLAISSSLVKEKIKNNKSIINLVPWFKERKNNDR